MQHSFDLLSCYQERIKHHFHRLNPRTKVNMHAVGIIRLFFLPFQVKFIDNIWQLLIERVKMFPNKFFKSLNFLDCTIFACLPVSLFGYRMNTNSKKHSLPTQLSWKVSRVLTRALAYLCFVSALLDLVRDRTDVIRPRLLETEDGVSSTNTGFMAAESSRLVEISPLPPEKARSRSYDGV